ncbi:hydrogenase maturation nickel metallochaperone HypA [Alisedimentitalea sp. MJ-SS2]|uniref:hydrogenase maturation nickel metallochaperone HypA n=1 Tax=Aliisedimentitalea sp. MJ-SS2 TaxID=3049795 RepID=UPI002913CF11|nr:hydrogenase maturation nickel metallochaperone HypA [Alisedimentitalea sp. MJ-SS2]MDU8925774.1 hydrogenase maturation nickel metallochaperone HypA [Alisedimentitalea sp. MJ-SS2]
MHEMALAESVVQIVAEQAAKAGAEAIKTVWIEIGELSHVEPEAMRFCFEAVAKDTRAEGATLEIIRAPGKAWCHKCADHVHVKSLVEACPKCGGYQLQVTGGDDMRVKEMEVT